MGEIKGQKKYPYSKKYVGSDDPLSKEGKTKEIYYNELVYHIYVLLLVI